MFSDNYLRCEDPLFNERVRRLGFLQLHATLGDTAVLRTQYRIVKEHQLPADLVWVVEYQRDEIAMLITEESATYRIDAVPIEEPDLRKVRKRPVNPT